MLNLIIGFVLGAIVMDFLWAWRLGMPQTMWRRFQQGRNDSHEDFK